VDKAEIKNLLASYRPEDAGDPIFTEALREAATDPELATWLAEMQRFDAVIASRLQEVVAPPELKSRILAGERVVVPAESPFRRRWFIPSSIAALFLLGLFFWQFLLPPRHAVGPLEAQAITFTNKMPPLQFVCFNAAAVAHWVNEQPASREVGLQLPPPDKSLSMAMIGSSIVHWDGHPVVMICLQNQKEMAMLYVLSGDEAPGLKDGATETLQRAGWVVRASKSNGQLHLLAAKGGPENLDFRMPF
jgi:hypothetical protein